MRKMTKLVLLVATFAACGVDEGPEDLVGKGDMIGNGGLDSACSFYGQCAADQGLICRPTVAGQTYEAGHGCPQEGPLMPCLPPKPQIGEPFVHACQLPGQQDEGCWRDEDCAAGLVCTDYERQNSLQALMPPSEGTSGHCRAATSAACSAGVATFCQTAYGHCDIGQQLCREGPCFCATDFGPLWGVAL